MRNPHPHDAYPHDHRSYGHRSYGPPRAPWRWDPTRQGPLPSSMRVSDAERTEVTNALCRHFADGRLDEAELNDRLARATTSKTRADLAPLLADLPRLDPGGPAPTTSRPRRTLTLLLLVALALPALGWGLAGGVLHVFHPHIPWLLIGILALLFLRGGHRHHHRHRI
jgi:hypothetical protein